LEGNGRNEFRKEALSGELVTTSLDLAHNAEHGQGFSVTSKVRSPCIDRWRMVGYKLYKSAPYLFEGNKEHITPMLDGYWV
jgi:hypothetical protein